MKNKISIIVPIFNSEKYLTRCLASLQNQTLGDYEVILINDGSIDHSACICNEFVQKDNRFRVIHKRMEGFLLLEISDWPSLRVNMSYL